jgi:hypothetical protein
MLTLKEALKTSNGKINRYILRLGKSEEEAGKFEPWGALPDTFEEDFQGFLACLRLTRLADSIAERMKTQKGSIRAIRKEQRETAKALQKEKDKLQKALDKAAKKVEREAEKQKIKAEAKAARETLKAAKKGALCTSTFQVQKSEGSLLASTTPTNTTAPTLEPSPPLTDSTPSPSTPVQETPQHAAIILTEVKETPRRELSIEEMLLSSAAIKAVVEALANPPAPNEALKAAAVRYEEETYTPTFKLPMEG